MANTVQHKRGSGTPAGGVARGELAIQEVAANYTTSSSSKLWLGEGATPNLRQIGFGIYDGTNQSGIPIGGNLTFTAGSGITTTVSSGTLTIAATGGGGSGTINSGSTNEVAHYTGSTTVDGHSGFTYDPVGQNVAIGNHLTAASATLSGTLEIDVGSGDPIIIFDTQGADKFTIGVDDSDSDTFKINSGSTLATTSDFRMDSSGNVTIQGSLTGASLDISGNCDIDGTMEADAITLNGSALGSLALLNSVAAGQIDANAVDSSELADGSVDLSHMSSQSVDEDNLYISNSGSNGQFLSKQSGDAGGLTWATPSATVLLDDIQAGDASSTLEVSSGDITIGARDQGVLKLDSIGFVKVLETKTSNFTPAEDACAYFVHCSSDPGPSANKSFRIDLNAVSSPVGGQTYEFFCEATSAAVATGNATITIFGDINDTPGPTYKEITICTATSAIGQDINKQGYARATYVDGNDRTGATNTWFVLVSQQATDRTSGVLGMD